MTDRTKSATMFNVPPWEISDVSYIVLVWTRDKHRFEDRVRVANVWREKEERSCAARCRLFKCEQKGVDKHLAEYGGVLSMMVEGVLLWHGDRSWADLVLGEVCGSFSSVVGDHFFRITVQRLARKGNIPAKCCHCCQSFTRSTLIDYFKTFDGKTSLLKTNSQLNRSDFAMLSRLITGHLRPMIFTSGFKTFPNCTKCQDSPASPEHITSDITEQTSTPAVVIEVIKRLSGSGLDSRPRSREKKKTLKHPQVLTLIRGNRGFLYAPGVRFWVWWPFYRSNANGGESLVAAIYIYLIYLHLYKFFIKNYTDCQNSTKQYLSPAAPLAKFLNMFLTPILRDSNSHTTINSIPTFIQEIWHTPYRDNHTMVSFDVVNLYPSLPHSLIIESTKNFLSQHSIDNSTSDKITKLISLSLKINIFTFNSKYYKQTNGSPIG
ncbi:hypothetical protein LAZ67_18002372 [Cordylochernes scorpioides]|uniref:Reverse transcriptase domain-containing protein n=1 Tax=Cordylochernes scorpioides TaxID=51811 RepID=A0ABY6LGL2_9ARAC|nr:hypothetical protein LAZ67_18002372 [Cordylochernes scorpioides]